MVLKSDKQKVKTLLSETIRLLCKNGLHFKAEFCVEALVGITLDREEEFFLSIKETVKTDIVTSTEEVPPAPSLKRRKEKRIKGEVFDSPQHSLKRPAETVTSEDGLPSLSLEDEQAGGQEFWRSIPGSSADGEQSSTPFKKRHIEPEDSDNEDDDTSNSNARIKGEPESDSDVEISGTEPAPMSMALQTYGYDGQPMPSLPQHVWDQLPPFSAIPGPSGIPSAAAIQQQSQDQSQVTSGHAVEKSSPGTKHSDDCGKQDDPSFSSAHRIQIVGTGLSSPGNQLVFATSVTPPRRGAKRTCPQCGTPCANKGSLQRHMKIHLEAPEFKCQTCGQSYYERWRLVRHQRMKHRGEDDQSGPASVQVTESDGVDTATAAVVAASQRTVPIVSEPLSQYAILNAVPTTTTATVGGYRIQTLPGSVFMSGNNLIFDKPHPLPTNISPHMFPPRP